MSENVTLTELLYNLQNYRDSHDTEYPQITSLPAPQDDQILKIDLNTRQIETPQFLSVQYDHNAEVVYFKCARYFENVDLTTKTCIIQYVNGNNQAGIQWVPYFDTDIAYDENDPNEPMMVIPWSIDGLATAYPGTVTFNVRFYEVSDDKTTLKYNLNTMPATAEVKHGIDFSGMLYEDGILEKFDPGNIAVESVYQSIKDAQTNATCYWMDV